MKKKETPVAGEAALPRRASPPPGERAAQGARRRPHPGGDGSARRRRQGSTRRPWKQICAPAEAEERAAAQGARDPGGGGVPRPRCNTSGVSLTKARQLTEFPTQMS